MPVFQHYYTSCQTSKMSGFQVKAQSPGLPADTAKTLEKLIGYQIPIATDVRNFTSHPIALRYYANEQEAMLISSQSNGEDELGRPGNFFAHSVVGTPVELTNTYAPIFYWKSPFWVKRDDSSTEILPSLPEFNPEITFNFDTIWEFIQQDNHQEWLYKLLCAVLDFSNYQRRIVILDEIESTALWIAAISIAFLPKYTQFLTFATYHHDPYRVPFLITGTTSDSNFRLSQDEYISYFVVNSLEKRISDAPDSDYAKYLVQNFTSERYDIKIIDFFNWLDGLELQSQLPERILDDCANFYLATVQSSLSPQSEKAVTAANKVIEIIALKSSFTPEDINDLQSAGKLLGEEMVRASNTNLIASVIDGLKTLKRAAPNFLQSCPDVLDLSIQLFLNQDFSLAEQLTLSLHELYSRPLVIQNLSHPHVLNRLTTHLSDNKLEQLTVFWKSLGKDIHLNEDNEKYLQIILEKTFALLNHLGQDELSLPNTAAQLISNLLLAKGISHDFILKSAFSYQYKNRQAVISQWLYYSFVENLSCKQRSSQYWDYWKYFEGIYPQLYLYELKRDILGVKTIQQQVNVVQQWVSIINSEFRPQIIRDAVDFLWGLPQINRRELACQLLSQSDLVQNLEPELYHKIVQYFLAAAKIQKPDQTTFRVYELIFNSQIQISPDIQTIIQGVIALFTGKLQEATATDLNRHFQRVDSTTYEEEVKQLMAEFFTSKYDPNSHSKLVSAVYQNRHSEIFWDLYWKYFLDFLLEKQRINEVLSILDFWFNSSAFLIENNYHYVVPEFFTELPSILQEITESKSYKRVYKDFENKIQGKRWHPVIQKYLKKNKSFFGLL